MWRAAGVTIHLHDTRSPRPSFYTFNNLIHASARAGKNDKASGWLRMMLNLGVSPTAMSYTSAINAFAKAGQAEAMQQFYDIVAARLWPDLGAVMDADAHAAKRLALDSSG